MKFVTYRDAEGASAPGLLENESIYDLRTQGFADLESLVGSGSGAWEQMRAEGVALPLAATQLLAPLLRPPRIFCVGLNYLDHAAETKMQVAKVPTIFMKLASGIVGPGDAVVLPSTSNQVDYEVELAVVIGKAAASITDANWRDVIFGYTILNDVSARDVQLATTQWTLGKSFPTFCPLGPYVVTADEIDHPHDLDIQLEINGEVLQQGNTSDLIFKLPAVLGYINSIAPLVSGDIVSTGTPPGVGMGRVPQRWLKPGEMMRCTVSGLGTLSNPVVAAP